MEAEKPVQPTDAYKPVPFWSVRRVCFLLALLFALIFAVAWWLTPIAPFATLEVGGERGKTTFSSDSTLLVTSGKESFGVTAGPLRVWDLKSGHERFSLAHDWKAIETVHFSPDCSMLAAHEQDGDLRIWDMRTGKEIASFRPKTHFGNWVNFRFSPNGHFLIFQDYSLGWPDKDYITFWNIDAGQEQGTIEGHPKYLVFLPDGDTFWTYRRKEKSKVCEVIYWKLTEGPKLLGRNEVLADFVLCSSKLTAYATADDLPNGHVEIKMRDTASGDKRWSVTLKQDGTHLQTLSLHGDGKILMAHGGGGTQRTWRGQTTLWEVSAAPIELGSFSETPVISPDGNWLVTPLDDGATLVSVSAPERGTDLVVESDCGPLGSYNGMRFYPTAAFSPDSKLLVVTGLYRVDRHSFLGKWLPQKFNPFRRPAGSIVRVWDVDSRREIFAFAKCSEVWFSPDGHVLATLRNNNAIDLWHVPLRSSPWHVLGGTVIVWLIAISVGWVGVKMRRKLLSRTNAPPHRSECIVGKQLTREPKQKTAQGGIDDFKKTTQ